MTPHRLLVCASFAALGFALSFVGACKNDDDTSDSEQCKMALRPASADFPRFVEDTSAGGPQLGFQVCDSKPGDLNGDGLLDFIAADHIGAGFGYFMQMPGEQLRFAEGEMVAFVDGGNSAGIVVEDFNGDGIPDVANSDHPGAVTVRINATPVGAGIDEVEFPAAGETNVALTVDHAHGLGFAGVEGGLIAADFNADGRLDIATANLGETPDGTYTSSFLLNTTATGAPTATFDPVQDIQLPGPAISIDSADFNGDGSPDVVTSNTGVSSLSILTNQTAAGESTVSFTRLDLTIPAVGNDAGAGPTNPVAADFNNDGKPDVVSANWNVDTVTLFTNTTESTAETTFTPEPLIVELCFNPLVARAGDLDGDGDQDLVIVPLDLTSAIAYGVIENQLEPGTDIPSLAFVEIVDLPERMQEVTFFDWLDGNSDGQSPGIWFTSTGNAADFDGDGALDITIAVAHGNFAIEMQGRLSKTDDIIDFVQPPVSLTLAQQFLPKHTELIHYVR